MFAMSLDEEFKNNPFMILLNPVLTLMGSVMEGTRIGIGNEADFMMTFLGFKEPPFKVNENDPFHLIASDNVPDWMETYFDQDQQFILHKFMKDLLNAVSSCIDKIFQYELNPPSLFRKTSNDEFNNDQLKCTDCKNRRQQEHKTLFKQCKHCVVTVSQTKIGIGLQFIWKSDFGDNIYCSVDLVPTFPIMKIDTLKLARIVNLGMLRERPEGWLGYMTKYVKSDMIVPDLLDGVDAKTNSVLLKIMNTSLNRNYFVRPGQCLGVDKFRTDRHTKAYSTIKALKQILSVKGLDNYMVKKLLLRPIEFESEDYYDFLFEVMSQSEIREKFKSINYAEWENYEQKKIIPLIKVEPLKRERPGNTLNSYSFVYRDFHSLLNYSPHKK
jgi:hypothetical protein